MRINSPSFGNYNPQTIVNNPPYITNYPFWEYLTEKKMNFKYARLDTIKAMKQEEEARDNIMTGLLTATTAGVALGLLLFGNKVRQLYHSGTAIARKFFTKKAG